MVRAWKTLSQVWQLHLQEAYIQLLKWYGFQDRELSALDVQDKIVNSWVSQGHEH